MKQSRAQVELKITVCVDIKGMVDTFLFLSKHS